jgi:LacI family transcriptional regulator
MKNVALCMELSDFYEHGIARGLVRYSKARPDWRIFGYGWMFRPLTDLEHWEGDGIIARVESPAAADRLAALGLPLVDVAGAYRRPNFRQVTNDDFLTGREAGSHLRSCGFERFAFLGVRSTLWSEARKAGFLAAVGAGSVPSFERDLEWWERGAEGPGMHELASFVSGLEPPCALFACNDTTGLRATEAARRLGLVVPDQLAILGVDDEDILCELASPSLSSVKLDCESIGFRAAECLDEVLEGGGPEAGAGLAIAPKEVVERESTLVYACSDPLVSKAATFIRARAHEGIGVPDILAVVSASRRALEVRFRSALGRSLHEEIQRVRLARARRLLRETGLTMEQIASDCGFGALQRFHAAFKEAEGVPPGEWRRRSGLPRSL